AALTVIHTQWLAQAGIDVPKDVPVEISPLFALDATGIAEQIESEKTLGSPHVIIGDKENVVE
ncbi:N-acetylglucosamine-1-phosphate uridyltransferase eukaryotic, partial [hydrothermal vent metagenome]